MEQTPEQEFEQAKYREFMTQWVDIEAIPACDEGIRLLMRFAEQSPSLYELAQRVNFIEPVHPGFRTNPNWLAFTRHWAGCLKCMEA